MFDRIKRFFQDRKLRKYASDLQTGILPMSEIRTVNAVIDVEEPGFDLLKEDILAWGRSAGLKVNIYFFDFRKLGKDELLLTTIDKTLLRKGLDWLGTPNVLKLNNLFEEKSDLFISMIDNGNFPIEFVSKCTKARFKIGRCAFKGHAFDMIVRGAANEDLRSDSRMIFQEITEFLLKIK
jgi:hypothetical protein